MNARSLGILLAVGLMVAACGVEGAVDEPENETGSSAATDSATQLQSVQTTVAMNAEGPESAQGGGLATARLDGAEYEFRMNVGGCLISESLTGFEFHAGDGSKLVVGVRSTDTGFSGTITVQTAGGFNFDVHFISLNDYDEDLTVNGGTLRYDGLAIKVPHQAQTGSEVAEVPVLIEATCT